jgi:hypothetical protein
VGERAGTSGPAVIYEILDGVRRSKAALLCGRETIAAQENGVGPEIHVPLHALRSPKDEIDATGVRGLSWGKILRATQNDVSLPPVEVQKGTRGIPLADVVIVGDDFDAFRDAFQQG